MADDDAKAGQIGKLLRAFDEAMKAEGIDVIRREHVINRLIYGDPHPDRRRVNEVPIEIHVTTPRPQETALAAYRQARQARLRNRINIVRY